MHRTAKPRPLILPAVATGVAIILALAAVLVDSLLQGPAAGVSLRGNLPATTAKAVDIITTSASSYLASALAVLGAIGFFVKSTLGKEFELTTGELVTLSISAALALASIFFGHLVSMTVFDMIANDFLTFQAANLRWSVRLAYVLLLLSVFELFVAVLAACFRMARGK